MLQRLFYFLSSYLINREIPIVLWHHKHIDSRHGEKKWSKYILFTTHHTYSNHTYIYVCTNVSYILLNVAGSVWFVLFYRRDQSILYYLVRTYSKRTSFFDLITIIPNNNNNNNRVSVYIGINKIQLY